MIVNVEKQRICEKSPAENVSQRANEVLSKHPILGGRRLKLSYGLKHNVLLVRGAVPSFYLKQVVQNALRDLDGVSRVDNQVSVVSSEGLSSVN
jgi:hypothetical protein